MASNLRWGILSTGSIARKFAKGIHDSETGVLVAVGSRTQQSADTFGDEFKIPKRFDSYDALLNDSGIDAIYIGTPHPMHSEWTIKAAKAGKHILCEKPLTVNAVETQKVIHVVRECDVFLMEAFMYRCLPFTQKWLQEVKDKTIGELKLVQISFSKSFELSAKHRIRAHELGGGAILDLGCYCASMARLIAGATMGKTFAEPIALKALGQIGSTRVDENSTAILEFENGLLTELAVGLCGDHDNDLHLIGTEGRIRIPICWGPSRFGGTASYFIRKRNEQEETEVSFTTEKTIYAIEIDIVSQYLDQRQAPVMSWDDTIGNMKVLDQWRNEIGMKYDFE